MMRHHTGGSVGKRGGQKSASARVDAVLHERDEKSEMQTASSRAQGERERAPVARGPAAAPTSGRPRRPRPASRSVIASSASSAATPAGEAGLLHEHRAAGVSREELDAAARRADRRVAHRRPPKR